MQPIPAHRGLLAHLVRSVRPDLADRIAATGSIPTAVVGLGGQGTRHAGLMKAFGTLVAGGVAPGRGGERVHETIPVFESVSDLLRAVPDLAAVSIWRHFSSARDAALEAIEARVPIVVLITEGIPLRDVRDVLAAADRGRTLLLGGNTPGVIFPPERIKIGMLPDVFHPEEVASGRAGPRGVTILSRSGAILYHMSDALASAGIAQNGVIGVGGDGAIGSTFVDLVPLVMAHEATDLVVVAGEIGGSQEERLARDLRDRPERYGKPLVALLSGAHAPAGKTMGHAGAIVAPGQRYGTFASKRDALREAGVTVVNSQYDLIEVVRDRLAGRTYFEPSLYYERMRETWEAPPAAPTWGTHITEVAPNHLRVCGYALEEIVGNVGLETAAALLALGELPAPEDARALRARMVAAARVPAPETAGEASEQLSTTLARAVLSDPDLAAPLPPAERAVTALGRCVRFLARILGNEPGLDSAPGGAGFGRLLAAALGADPDFPEDRRRLLESLAVASVDHGVTPPSAQATILAATVRAPYPMALASGLGAITDIHGGAGAQAAEFFLACVRRAEAEDQPVSDAALDLLFESCRTGSRIAGLGHRIHTEDPRRGVILRLAEAVGAAGPCVRLSREIEGLFEEVRGFRLPINVDGVIGAVAADLGLPPVAAKALFVLGRVAGLSAHFFEETRIHPPMRPVRFDQAVYRGPGPRPFPESR